MTDLIAMARSLGVDVFIGDRDDDVRVVLLREAWATTITVVSTGVMEQERRALAHALSLLWRNDHRPDFGFVVRDMHLRPGADAESARANRFADALIGSEVTV